MVNLRRGPRLQRKCNTDTKVLGSPQSIKTPPKKPSKVKRKASFSRIGNSVSGSSKEEKANKTSSKTSDGNCVPKNDVKLKTRRSSKSRLFTDKKEEKSIENKSDSITLEVGKSKTNNSVNQGQGDTVRILNSHVVKNSSKQTSSVINANPTISSELQPDQLYSDCNLESYKFKEKKTSLRPLLIKDGLIKQKNDIFLPRITHNRKQRVSVEVASEVQNEERVHSVCSVILDKQRKRQKIDSKDIDKKESVSIDVPSFNGISPIVPSKRESEKLEILEKSMNLFQCPVSPINSNISTQKSFDYSHLALKSDVKSLPKRPKTRPLKNAQKGSSKTPRKCRTPNKDPKDENISLLKTPLRQVFKSNVSKRIDVTSGDNVEPSDDEEDNEGNEGYALFPLSKDAVVASTARSKATNKSTSDPQSLEFEDWLEAHQSDFDQFKDMDLCVE